MLYYFQIFDPYKRWESNLANSLFFENRQKAMDFGRNLAYLFKKEVRVTDNEKLLGGTYLSC